MDFHSDNDEIINNEFQQHQDMFPINLPESSSTTEEDIEEHINEEKEMENVINNQEHYIDENKHEIENKIRIEEKSLDIDVNDEVDNGNYENSKHQENKMKGNLKQVNNKNNNKK